MAHLTHPYAFLPTDVKGWREIVEPAKDAYWLSRRNGKTETEALLSALDVAVAAATSQGSPQDIGGSPMADHTPTPWKFSPNSFGTQFIYGDLQTPKQSPMGVTYFHLVAGGDHPGTLTEANAALIVKAVNNHEALVSLLEDAVLLLELDLKRKGQSVDNPTPDSFLGKARKVLGGDVGGPV